jgi:hypothetical protein
MQYFKQCSHAPRIWRYESTQLDVRSDQLFRLSVRPNKKSPLTGNKCPIFVKVSTNSMPLDITFNFLTLYYQDPARMVF